MKLVRACRLAVVAAILCCRPGVAIDVPEYFPEVAEDLTNVTWAHAVNSQALLQQALDGDVMMLEADVVLGILKPESTAGEKEFIPVMAHPPAFLSDLTLEEFLDRTINSTETRKRGIKLDFKSLAVVGKSLDILEAVMDRINFPVWLNADILPGPVNSTGTPVDATEFLQQCSDRFPTSTLSLGWTTRFGKNGGVNITEGEYTSEHVTAMKNALTSQDISQGVTFAVRAGIAALSSEELLGLVESTPNSTLTVWSPATDPVDFIKLRAFIEEVGRHRVYVDMPEEMKTALDATMLAGSATTAVAASGVAILPAALLLLGANKP